MSTVGELIRSGQTQLQASLDPAAARAEAETLLGHVLEKDRSWLFAWSDQAVTAADQAQYQNLLQQRASGTPIAYLFGYRDFWTLRLKVTPDTLIPRPETEHLVEQALDRLNPATQARILDLGTGSGAIALALASEAPKWQIYAVDISEGALAVAQDNAQQHQLSNITFIRSHWFEKIEGKFDLVVSNPPYIEATDHHLQQGDLRYEPLSALASGSDGLNDIREIVEKAHKCLLPGGWLMFEHGYDQGQKCREILTRAGYESVFSHNDLAGHCRLSGGKHPLDPQGN